MKYNEMSKAQRAKIMLQGIMECIKELTEEEQNKILNYCGLQKIK